MRQAPLKRTEATTDQPEKAGNHPGPGHWVRPRVAHCHPKKKFDHSCSSTASQAKEQTGIFAQTRIAEPSVNTDRPRRGHRCRNIFPNTHAPAQRVHHPRSSKSARGFSCRTDHRHHLHSATLRLQKVFSHQRPRTTNQAIHVAGLVLKSHRQAELFAASVLSPQTVP